MSPGAKADVAGRLREALEAGDANAESLANRTDIAVADIHKLMNGERDPSDEELAQLAESLDLDAGWLRSGEGRGPHTDLQEERDAYQAEVGWRFRSVPADGGRDYGNANVWAFDPTLDIFVREVGQNVLDVVRGTSATLIFRVIRLKGSRRDAFLEALQWDVLQEHLQASATEGQKFGDQLAKGLARVEGEDELLLLRIEEHRTRGLTGTERGTDSNFTALVRNSLDSQKEGAGAGGAFGLGKAVLWRTSALSTVLFNSDLAIPQEGKQEGRIIGRSDLSFHQVSDHEFAGPGWFGKVEDEQAESSWGNRALAEDLLLKRPPGMSGTSTLIVGFHDPTAEEPLEAELLKDQLAAAAGRHFWPAIIDGDLEITVEVADGPDDDDRVSMVRVDPSFMTPEFNDLHVKYLADETVETLEADGDVAVVRVPIKVPARRDGEHHGFEHDAELLVRRADAYDEANEVERNVCAYMRGTGMVVEYRPMANIRVGARPFQAAVLCGTAASDEAEAEWAEEFLRLAEPPSHDTWERTTDLATKYYRGSGVALDQFRSKVREAIAELVGPAPSDLSDGPQGLKRLLAIKAAVDRVPHPTIKRIKSATIEDDDAWRLTVEIAPASEETWTAEPAALFGTETGTGTRVAWKSIDDCKNCEWDADEGRLTIPSGRRKVEFTGVTDPETHPLPADQASIVVDLRSLEASGGDDG